MYVLNVCIVCVWDACQAFLYVTFAESGGGFRCISPLHKDTSMKERASNISHSMQRSQTSVGRDDHNCQIEQQIEQRLHCRFL